MHIWGKLAQQLTQQHIIEHPARAMSSHRGIGTFAGDAAGGSRRLHHGEGDHQLVVACEIRPTREKAISIGAAWRPETKVKSTADPKCLHT